MDQVTLIGTLPPIKGISDCCIEQVQSLSKRIKIDFINFKAIYPEFLYPAGTKEKKDETFKINLNETVKVRELLAWYDPFSWIRAGLSIRSKIVHFHWWTFYLFPVFFTVVLCSKLRRKKIVCTVHNVLGHESGILDRVLTKLIFRLPAHFIVPSKSNRNQMQEFFKVEKEKISVIPLGPYNFYKDEVIEKNMARAKLSLSRDDKIILCFGNIRKYKGIDVLIKALVKVKKEVHRVKLMIVGKNWIDWQPFQNLIGKYNLNNDIITHLNYVPSAEVKYYFFACDLVVLPYLKFEGQSGPGNIALAFGKPPVVSNVGGLPELVKDENVVVNSANMEELANVIVNVLKNSDFRKKLESDSKQLAKEHSWDVVAERTTELYNLILKQ
jgi:glycosyltransferase involved in cell wall biosynthesis